MVEDTSKDQNNKRRRGRPSTKGSADMERILDVALLLFARQGYDGVSFALLSEKTGEATSLFNYHYGSKEGLWRAALIKSYKALADDADKSSTLFKDLDPLSYSKAMTRWFIQYSGTHPELYQVMTFEMASRSGRGKWLMENIAVPLSKRLAFSHRQQIESGILKPIPIANWLSIILGACTSFFMMKHQLRHQFDVDVYDDKEIEQHADVVIDVLYSGIMAG